MKRTNLMFKHIEKKLIFFTISTHLKRICVIGLVSTKTIYEKQMKNGMSSGRPLLYALIGMSTFFAIISLAYLVLYVTQKRSEKNNLTAVPN